MKNSKKVMAVLIMAALLSGCGGSTEKDTDATTTKKAETTTTTTTAAEETEAPDESEAETSDESEDDNTFSFDIATDGQTVPDSYTGDIHYKSAALKTLGDVFENVEGSGIITMQSGSQFMCIVCTDSLAARFIANMDEDTQKKLDELEFTDSDYDEKRQEILKDIKIASATDYTSEMPAQAELDKYVGKKLKALKDDGYKQTGWYSFNEESWFDFMLGNFDFEVEIEETLDDSKDYDEDGASDDYTIKSIIVRGLSYNTYDIYDLYE